MSTSAMLISGAALVEQSNLVQLATLARQSLIAEVELTPKPGLVDRRGSGAHGDLSLPIMRRSALAIEPYFYEMAASSRCDRPSQSLQEHLAVIGREGGAGNV